MRGPLCGTALHPWELGLRNWNLARAITCHVTAARQDDRLHYENRRSHSARVRSRLSERSFDAPLIPHRRAAALGKRDRKRVTEGPFGAASRRDLCRHAKRHCVPMLFRARARAVPHQRHVRSGLEESPAGRLGARVRCRRRLVLATLKNPLMASENLMLDGSRVAPPDVPWRPGVPAAVDSNDRCFELI